jgi:hypothetical protein
MESPTYYAYCFSTGGCIYDCYFTNFNGNARSGGFVVHLYPDDASIMDQIVFDQITGTTQISSCVGIVRQSVYSVGQIGRVIFRNVQPSPGANITPVFSIGASTIDSLTITDCSVVPGITTQANLDNFITFSGSPTITELVTERIRVKNIASSGSGASIFFYVNGAAITRLVMRDWMVAGGASQTLQLLEFGSTSNTIGEILVDGGYFDSGVYAIVSFPSALASGTPNITLRNVDSNYATYAVRFSALVNAHIRLEGNTFATNGAAIDTTVANTLKISSAGDNDFVTNPCFATSASPTVTMYGNDLTYDVGLLATTAGQYCNHSSAVSGRNSTAQQGLAFASGGSGAAHWYAQYLTTLIV